MKMKMTTLAIGFALILSSRGYGAELTYPGASPCDSTLQACIDGASAGDAIAVATDARIDENLDIAKSLSLVAAPGAKPLIGNANAKTPRKLTVHDAGLGSPAVAVELNGINFDGAILEADYANGSGHSFTMKGSRVYAEVLDGVSINTIVPMNAVIRGNSIVSVNKNILFYTGLKTGTASLEATGNLITSSDNSKSYGVSLDFRGGGSVISDFRNNVIYSVSGCGCGSSSAIDVSVTDSANATLRFTNNTIDDTTVGSGPGINVRTNGGTGKTVVDIFNNAITRAYRPVDLQANANLTVNGDNNHFYGNKHGENAGGYDLGANTVLNAAMIDPLYVDAVNRNYRLQPGSPLVDNGENAPAGGLPATDADGKARVIDGTVDIGAFESGQAVSDLQILQELSSLGGAVGGQITIALSVTNLGPEASVNTILTDELPEGLAYVASYSDRGECSFDASLTCALGDLAVDETALVVIVADAEAQGVLTNTAAVASESFDSDTSNNASEVSFTVDAADDGTAGGDTSGTAGAEDSSGGCSLIRS